MSATPDPVLVAKLITDARADHGLAVTAVEVISQLLGDAVREIASLKAQLRRAETGADNAAAWEVAVGAMTDPAAQAQVREAFATILAGDHWRTYPKLVALDQKEVSVTAA